MSDTTPSDGAAPRSSAVSMTKPASGQIPASGGVPIPRMINLACAALGLVVFSLLVRALGLLGSSATLRSYLITANNNAKSPVKNFDVNSALHTLRVGAFVNLVVYAVVFGLLVWALRRPRSAAPSRWVLLVVMVLTSVPLYIVPSMGWPSGIPVVARAGGLAVGVFSIAAVLLIFGPRESQSYFRACREASAPAGGQPRPGLGALFGQRRGAAGARGAGFGGAFGGGSAADASAGRRTTRPSAGTATRPAATRPAAGGKARAKGRADADSVARGAELGRARAKASKSRRSAD